MCRAILTLSNGDTLELHEGQIVMPIAFIHREEEAFTSMVAPYELWYHVHDGLIPCITELLCRYEFFQIFDNEESTVYKSSAIVSIKNV